MWLPQSWPIKSLFFILFIGVQFARQSDHLVMERTVQSSYEHNKKTFPGGSWCGCVGDVKSPWENSGLEDIKLPQLERRKCIWVAWGFLVPGELLYKPRKRFIDMKCGAKQVGRSCWFGAERGSSTRESIEDIATLFIHTSCVIMACLRIWQSVTEKLWKMFLV